MNPPILKEHENILVVRDDLIPYGSKARFLDSFFSKIDQDEVVYGGSPRWGFAQISIAYLARKHGKKATIFVPWSKELSSYSQRARSLGANIVQVPVGFLSVCHARAKDHVAKTGAFLLPFGLNVPEAVKKISAIAKELRIQPDEVWTVAGSGTLSRGLQRGFPNAKFYAVQTGRKLTQLDVGRATIIASRIPFSSPAKILPPFPSVPEYDAKAWEFIPKDGKKLRLFWNVAGP